MSANLRNLIKTLEMVASIKDIRKRNQVLKLLSNKPELYKALREIAHNTVNKNIKLEPHHKTKLRKYKQTFIDLSVKSKGIRKKKALVEQSGGFLPILIPLVLSLLNGADS
jgi:hypothetical protein